MNGQYPFIRRGQAVLIASIMIISALAMTASSVMAGKPSQPSADEQAFIAALEDDYAWTMTERMVNGGPVVAGTTSSATAANMLAAEMHQIGLEPGLPGGYIEDFTIYGWEEISSSVEVVSPEARSILCAQAYKDAGTGPGGVTAPLVYINLARWDDFERHDVSGKIVLFHRQNPMFYGLPSLAEAMARGALGALMDYPIITENALKNDVTGVSIPAVYISNADSADLQGMLASGQEVIVKLVVDNEVGDRPLAHNVVGVIPGAVHPEEFVYVTAHFDHWFSSACDDGAGIGSLFAIAKAVKVSGLQPARTLVFVAFDSEELGGQPDTWYDWCLGSYSHIVATLDGGPALNSDRPGKIAAMLNMDVIGVRDAVVFVETTPELTQFFKIAARDAGLSATAPTYVYWPPSSYDDWPFYMVGVPVMQIAWWGPYYDTLYHTTDDTMDKIDPEHLHVNMVFVGISMVRLAQAKVLPYGLAEVHNVAVRGIEDLLSNDPNALGPGKANIEALRSGMDAYYEALTNAAPKLAAKYNPSPSEAARINQLLMASEVALLPHLFDWDAKVVPGWTGLFLFDTYANDLYWMNKAIQDLTRGNIGKAKQDLASVTTMKWGQYVGEEAYAHVLDEIAFPEHALWADGHLPTLTQVHTEYMSLMGRLGSSGMDRSTVLSSLEDKRDAIYGYITSASVEAGTAFANAAAILAEI
jgi:Iap family predicted aminopeptidase